MSRQEVWEKAYMVAVALGTTALYSADYADSVLRVYTERCPAAEWPDAELPTTEPSVPIGGVE